MTNYEVMFIINTALEDAEKEAFIERIKDVIAQDGEVSKVDVWGNRKLAYLINKKSDGYYVLIEFKANPSLPAELDRRLRIADGCIRHMIINKSEK